ncbi:acyl-homoserine-lactone synthase [Tateyamaria omphalii]|uniref:acyl-homoserine-lactone synthase n=1 Tax=Tateyamaria omphalii TaxID=299262 RepID=UPI001E40307F|nr:acyl-homoserine-lactone synthase [Tateyamaria omphalii]
MFALRARQFKHRRNWSLTVVDNAEKDRFDDLDPLYICVTDQGRLLASLRLLPTTGPNMLRDVFPEVGAPSGPVRDPLIHESSRFCVDTEAVRNYGLDGINHVTRELLTGLFTHALDTGLINIVSVYDLYLERILRRAGCRFERLGAVHRYDGLATVAGLFEVSQEVIDELRPEPLVNPAELSPTLGVDLANHAITAARAL